DWRYRCLRLRPPVRPICKSSRSRAQDPPKPVLGCVARRPRAKVRVTAWTDDGRLKADLQDYTRARLPARSAALPRLVPVESQLWRSARGVGAHQVIEPDQHPGLGKVISVFGEDDVIR